MEITFRRKKTTQNPSHFVKNWTLVTIFRCTKRRHNCTKRRQNTVPIILFWASTWASNCWIFMQLELLMGKNYLCSLSIVTNCFIFIFSSWIGFVGSDNNNCCLWKSSYFWHAAHCLIASLNKCLRIAYNESNIRLCTKFVQIMKIDNVSEDTIWLITPIIL